MVVMVLIAVRSQVIPGYAVSEVHLLDDMHLAKQFERPIYGSQSDLWSLLLDEHEHVFRAQMVFLILQQHPYSRFSLRG
ncbi:hypothetical protein D3C84_1088600 [compost metagenome]